jgi:DNA-binding MarR family transcriptional regulator
MANDAFAISLERYLSETLHDHIRVNPFKGSISLPAFVELKYKLYDARIAGRRCVIIATEDNVTKPSDIAKHVALVRGTVDAAVVFAAPSLSAHNRSRMISQNVSFVVPGNQLYIPELAVDLREHFRAAKPQHADGLSPAAQAVLFHHLLHLHAQATTPSEIAECLNYSRMSIGRAFDDLAVLQLAKAERRGRERYLVFNTEGRKLLESARKLLRSPVRAVKYVKRPSVTTNLKLAGEAALAELTDLSRPKRDTYAAPAAEWKSIMRAFKLVEVSEHETDFSVETWSYDPAGLSSGRVVDSLSLYAQFSGHHDERVAMAAEKLLETFTW